MDGIVSFLGKIVLTFLCIYCMLTVGAVLIQVGEKNDYKQYVNDSIERFGGLTTEAVTDIKSYSERNFDGRFEIKTTTEKKLYGESIPYTFEMTIKPVFMDFENFKISLNGLATSKVR